MKRFMYAALTFGALATPVSAAGCVDDYKSFLERFNTGPAKELTGQQLAIVYRQALRAFDGCNTGDENTTKTIFQQLEQVSPAKDQAFWTSLERVAPAKK
jgi:hypothetical protein